jgi:LDH2 family malate/lactate/ureidoglycolate dehydrogenase
MERCMLAVGTKPDHAKSLASCLIAGDYRGHFSHGLNRLDM